MKKIIIADYDEQWPKQFQQLKEMYTNALGDLITAVEHVGSTAVPGLAAKPIIDIDLVIAGEDKLDKIIPLLSGLGYEFRGDLGIKDRYAFNAISEYVPVTATKHKWPKHHLYCCIAHSISLQNHLVLRDALRINPTLATAYADLKRMLAANVNDDIDAYVEGKTAFISKILADGGLSAANVLEIGEQNKKK